MTARLYDWGPARLETHWFEVPRQDFASILSALENSSRDFFPYKWRILGELRIACKGGQVKEIHLYMSNNEPIAFSIERDGGNNLSRPYYRFGQDKSIKATLAKAHNGLQAIHPHK